jgi:hypothetical protein
MKQNHSPYDTVIILNHRQVHYCKCYNPATSTSLIVVDHALRALKRLGFIPPFFRRASNFRANLSEDCYVPSRVLQLKTRKGTFIRIVWTIIRKVSWTTFISTQIYSHLGKSEMLIFNIRFISAVHNRRIKSRSTKHNKGSEWEWTVFKKAWKFRKLFKQIIVKLF